MGELAKGWQVARGEIIIYWVMRAIALCVVF